MKRNTEKMRELALQLRLENLQRNKKMEKNNSAKSIMAHLGNF